MATLTTHQWPCSVWDGDILLLAPELAVVANHKFAQAVKVCFAVPDKGC